MIEELLLGAILAYLAARDAPRLAAWLKPNARDWRKRWRAWRQRRRMRR